MLKTFLRLLQVEGHLILILQPTAQMVLQVELFLVRLIVYEKIPKRFLESVDNPNFQENSLQLKTKTQHSPSSLE